ncbi:hypothetical protein K1719_037525 [Acacia pycnantha]|nr:hypothetical protein K1719_037525 [Acacia pycnantha]
MEAERRIAGNEYMEYLPIGGSIKMVEESLKLAYGENSEFIKDNRIAAVQALSGTFRYYHPETRGLDFAGLMDEIKKQAAKKDSFQLFAEKVRDHKDLVSRWAVLQKTRVEYFRGKDFVSFMKNQPELKDILFLEGLVSKVSFGTSKFFIVTCLIEVIEEKLQNHLFHLYNCSLGSSNAKAFTILV